MSILAGGHSAPPRASTMRFYAGPALLVIDELGCAPRGADVPRGMRDPPPFVAAGGRSYGQAGPGVEGEGRSSPDKVGTGRHCQMARAR